MSLCLVFAGVRLTVTSPTCITQTTPHDSQRFFFYFAKDTEKKLASYGTDGRLLLTANFKVT